MVEITATGVAGVSLVAIKGRGEILPPQIEVSPDQLVFGQTQPGDSSSATLSISNTGPGPLYVQSMTFVGPDAEDFTLSGIAGDPFMVLPGMLSKDITVQFTPKTYKTYRATLAIGSDDPNLSVVNVALEGEGGPLVAETLPVLYGLGGRCSAVAMYGTQTVIGQGMILSVYGVADRLGRFFVVDLASPAIPRSCPRVSVSTN